MSRECIGCGCTDLEACEGGCSWEYVSADGELGICSSCVDAFDDPEERLAEAAAGLAPRWEASDDEHDSGLILPGDPEYDATLRGER